MASGGLPDVVGRVERCEDVTPEEPYRVAADPATTPLPHCQAAHHQNTAVTVMQPQSILIKLAEIALGATVRWRRSKRQEVRDAEDKQDTEMLENIKHRSKLLSRTRCHESQTTRWMQLRASKGYKDIHCQAFEKH